MNKFVFILIILLFPLSAFATLSMSHYPLKRIDQNTTNIKLTILESDTDISNVQIFYKTNLEDVFKSYELDDHITSNNEISIPILPLITDIDFENGTMLQYYIVVSTTDGNSYTLPEINPEFNPYSVSIVKNDYQDAFIVISPDDISEAKVGDKLIISYYSIKDLIDSQQIKVTINSKDVTKLATVEGNLIVITVNESMKNGTLLIESVLNNGDKIESKPYVFSRVNIKSEYSVYGNGTFISNYNNIKTDYDSLSMESGHDEIGIFNITANYKRLFWKNYFYISSLETKNNQSVNRYYTGFISPYFDFHLGDYNPNFSELTLYNKNVQGISAKIKASSFSITGVYGQSARKISSRTTETGFIAGTYKRETMGARIAMGTSSRVKFSINIVKNKDDLNSLNESDYIKRIVYTDSLTNLTITDTVSYRYAKDNIVCGADFDIEVVPRYFSLFGEAAMSMYNSNINPGVMTRDELEDYIDRKIPFDPETVESIITINKNIEPFEVGISNTAFKAGMRLNFWRNSLMTTFYQIGPSYYSLSSTGVNQDYRSIKLIDNLIITPSFYISGGFERNNDNIVNQKDATTTNTTFFTSANYQPILWPYLSVNFMNTDNTDDRDTLSMAQNFQSLQFNTGYTYSKLDFAQLTFDIQYGIGTDKEKNQNLFDNKRNDLGFSTFFRFKQIPLLTRTGIVLNMNKNDGNSVDVENVDFTTFYLNNEYSILNNKVIPFMNLNMQVKNGDIDEYSTTQINIGSKYAPFKKTWIVLDMGVKTFNHTKSYSGSTVRDDYSNYFSKFTINTSF